MTCLAWSPAPGNSSQSSSLSPIPLLRPSVLDAAVAAATGEAAAVPAAATSVVDDDGLEVVLATAPEEASSAAREGSSGSGSVGGGSAPRGPLLLIGRSDGSVALWKESWCLGATEMQEVTRENGRRISYFTQLLVRIF